METKAYSYDDIYLSPKYSDLRSRSDADISVNFLGRKFKAPWIPANMESVIDEKIAKWLSENDYFYIHHRFGDTQSFIRKANAEKWKTISISIGVKREDRDIIRLIEREELCANFITIDVAHGHSILVKEMIEYVRAVLPQVKIIAGNVATDDAVRDLVSWGADAIKVGIAGGAACSTKHQTGFHVPMFTCVQNCRRGLFWTASGTSTSEYVEFETGELNVPIIADGGIRENGHMPKALVAGATMIMAGSLFAACEDAPGENVYGKPEGLGYRPPIVGKKYHGSASAKQKGERKHVEGLEMEIPCNGMTYEQKYNELSESLRSAVSYSGGKSLEAFETVEYIVVK